LAKMLKQLDRDGSDGLVLRGKKHGKPSPGFCH
jgi:hypothetical protein